MGSHIKKKIVVQRKRRETTTGIWNEIKEIPKEDLVYVDESGINECLVREMARAPRKERVYGETSGKKFARENMIAGWNCGKVVAPMGFKCNCNATLVETWAEKCLVPELKPGQVVILDNAKFHNKEKVRKIIEKAGCRVIFLPPYSPDLNPIEHFWDWLKNKIRDIIHQFKTLEDAMMAAVNAK
ncbi:transposase [Alphaproteobacteria bacterium]|nr:transposase [Alphaproteobacteria bacterium]